MCLESRVLPRKAYEWFPAFGFLTQLPVYATGHTHSQREHRGDDANDEHHHQYFKQGEAVLLPIIYRAGHAAGQSISQLPISASTPSPPGCPSRPSVEMSKAPCLPGFS